MAVIVEGPEVAKKKKNRPQKKRAYQATQNTTASANFWPKSKGNPNKKNPAPKGYDWLPVNNKAGTFLGWMLVKDTGEGGPSGGGGGGSYSYGGGGGGGSAKAGLSAYIQQYRLMFDDAGAKPPADLLKRAEAGNWSMAYFKMMVRLQDKAYFRSAEAKQRLAELNSYWKAVLPGTKLNRNFAKDYLRHGWTATQLQNQISQLPAFKKQYPFWQAFMKAQRQQGTAKAINPLQYKAYAKSFADVYKQAGVGAPEGYERLFFRSGLTDEEFVRNYSMLAETRNAAQWDVGGLTEQQQRAGLFDQKGASQVRGLLQQALNKQQRFMQVQTSPYRLAEENSTLTLRGI
ncbi:MAG: hypothetical protein PHV98_04765 [Candidatus Omnitrophica bacterium]|nr:hypothetical protein [Candidatus Omnitrophota bacterium]